MKEKYFIAARILILLVSVLIADGGKSFILENINVHFALYHSHSHDNDLPGQETFRVQADHEYFLEPDNSLILTPSFLTENVDHLVRLKSSDYPGAIWQPPKSV
jgi:hypothetical protein